MSVVESRNPYGHVIRDGFIGVALYPDIQSIKVYLHCEYYPKAQELKDKLTDIATLHGVNPHNPTPAEIADAVSKEELSELVIELAKATMDSRDIKRFFAGGHKHPHQTQDVITHDFPTSSPAYTIGLDKLTFPGLILMNNFYTTMLSKFPMSDMRNYDKFAFNILRMQKEHMIKSGIKFVTDWDEKNRCQGWTE